MTTWIKVLEKRPSTTKHLSRLFGTVESGYDQIPGLISISHDYITCLSMNLAVRSPILFPSFQLFGTEYAHAGDIESVR